jgi:hypothetical protein
MGMRIGFTMLAIIVGLCCPSHAEMVPLGYNGEGVNFVIDTGTIERKSYSTLIPAGAVHTIEPKMYRQVWVQGFNAEKVSTGQFLWVFNCEGRAGELASAAADTKKNYDVTARVMSGTIDPYMQAIPPNSFYKSVEKIVCK